VPLTVGLTGGIAAGKSAVLDRLRELGAVVVDSDDVARDVVEPGTDGFSEVVERFGPDVVRADGSLDRARLAAIVFADPTARAALEAIVHPRVRAEVCRRIRRAAAAAVVVNAVPLLVEAGIASDYDRIVVVEAPVEARIRRLAHSRGMSRAESLARMAAQADDERRRAIAWRVLVNDGSVEELRAQVDDVWRALQAAAGLT
jgi:dephospho-CoA kinase